MAAACDGLRAAVEHWRTVAAQIFDDVILELPEWADLIGRAIAWREAPADADGASTDAETRRFIEHVRRRILD